MKIKQWFRQFQGSEVKDSLESRHIPLIVNPLEDRPRLHSQKLTSKDRSDVENELRFKRHREASASELFYDLFFVANLAVFTENHEIQDASSFRSYLGFFSLLWATWLQTTLFDVRFYYDSVFARICKAIHFGVSTGFILAGAVYSTDPYSADSQAFQTLAIVQMISRLTLVVEYGSVLWYVKGFPRTRIPLLLIMGVLFAAAMLYLGTFWGFNPATNKTYYAWYIAAPIEVVLCIIISSIWRVLSFSRTHLVERVGLLTLIIIGEGVLGLGKSVSYLFQASEHITGRNIGVLIASVLLIYFIWMLYFDQIQNERFGTIKQQIWTILHYPLHLCILFTVEGSTNLFKWNDTMPLYIWWVSMFPYSDRRVSNVTDFYQEFPTKQSVIDYSESALKNLSSQFTAYGQVYKYYDYNKNISSLQNISAPFESLQFRNSSADILLTMWQGVGNAIFEVFGVIPPEGETTKALSQNPLTAGSEQRLAELNGLFAIYEVVFSYFYIAAGLFLFTLAVMYVIGNKRKTAGEYLTVGVRIFVGAGITMTLVGLTQNPHIIVTGRFLRSPWHVIIVMLCYFIVIVIDNVVVELALRKRRRASRSQDTEKQTPFPRQGTRVFSYERASSEDTAYSAHPNRHPHAYGPDEEHEEHDEHK